MRPLAATSLLLLIVPAALFAQTPDSVRATTAPTIASWTADRRTFQVGDVITVIVDESTLAVRDRSDAAANDRNTRAGAGGSVRTGSSSGGGNVNVDLGLRTSSSETGRARRQDRLTAEVTVRVTAIEAGGILRLEGSKAMLIDGREQKVTLSGLARPADIAPQNVIDSWRIADASIAYFTDGKLSKPKQGMIAKILGLVWP
jgi:flagellar L-ring protein precursor FlgH